MAGAGSWAPDPTQAVAGADAEARCLAASPRHYANIVKGEFRSVGIGVVPGPDGRLWTSQLFAG